MIVGYRMTFTVETYDEVLEVHRAVLAAIPSGPRGVLVQALDENGAPLWSPPNPATGAKR